MTNSLRLCIVALVLLLATTFAVPRGGVQAVDTKTDEELVQSLRRGGFNIYFRHAQTDWSQYDDVRGDGDWLSCDPARIRQLSDAGRETARAIGQAMRRLAIPVGQVLASPYCRTRETAELLGFGAPESTTDVMNMRVAERFGGRSAIVATARARLGRAPQPGSNTVIVAHGNVARDATPVYPDEAEAVVFQPLGSSDFKVIALIPPERWEQLATAHGKP